MKLSVAEIDLSPNHNGKKRRKMLQIAPGHAVNLKNVAYIKATPQGGGTTSVYTIDGERLVKKGVLPDYERVFADAKISILLYTTQGGDQTVIVTDHLIELLDDAGKGSVTYKMRGGYSLGIDGGGNFLNHLKSVRNASAEYQKIEAPLAAGASAIGNGIQQQSCGHCGSEGAGQRCAGCKSVYYCSPAHQVLHWNRHQAECRVVPNQLVFGNVASSSSSEAAAAYQPQ